ncbi:hypothetical protein QUB75_11950 [Microcoleus sp. K1-B6]|uniref:hypothetical protein n=1 Tax=unclassified Microcoleus TaxID=2642155 RepID=UPI002FD450EB
MLLYLQQLEQQVPVAEHLLVAIDHTAWGRPDAKTLKDRTHEYQGGVIIGQGYSTIAWIPEAQGSWALPLLHERIRALLNVSMNLHFSLFDKHRLFVPVSFGAELNSYRHSLEVFSKYIAFLR